MKLKVFNRVQETTEVAQVNGIQIVVKAVPFSPDGLNELSVLQQLQHPNIIELLNFVVTATQIKMYFPLIQETLLDRVQKSKHGLSFPLVRSIFSQIISCLGYIHSQNIVHQDLKLENILIDENDRIYITDFGFSRSYQPGVHDFQQHYGSTHYAAPEIWNLQRCEGPEVDMWSLGVCLFLMVTAYFPFGGETAHDVWSSVRGGLQWIPKHIRRDSDLCELIKSLLDFSTKSRISLAKVATHPWIQRP